MAGKITASFGADISEVESKMVAATRATKAYERAVTSLDGKNAGAALAGNMGKVNGSLGEIVRKFSAGRILESVLGGVGLGSGFAIAQKAAEMISSHWEKAAESAKAIAEYSSKTTDVILERIGMRQNDQQKLDAAKLTETKANNRLATASRMGVSGEEMARLNLEAQEASLAREKAEKKVAENIAADRKKKAEEAKVSKERDFELFMQSQERLRDAEKKAADEKEKLQEKAKKDAEDFFKDIDEAAEKYREEETKRIKDLAKLRYERAWEYATIDQRFKQVVKEGREAQAKADKNASSENLIALEEARKKYREILDEVEKLNEEKKKGNESGPDENGKFRTKDGKAIVSAEDRASSDATRAKNARFEEQSKAGRIRDAGRVGKDGASNAAPVLTTNQILARIETLLKPVKVPQK